MMDTKYSNWISIEDRLPEDDGLPLIAHGYILNDDLDRLPSTEIVRYHNGDFQIDFEWMAVVTHWMPLPEPPS